MRIYKGGVEMDNLQQIENESKKNIEQRDIAIIGLACRFPKAKDKDEFWNNLMNGVDCVSEVPKNRWNSEEFYSQDIKEQNKTYCKWLGALENIDLFDNQFFNISPREASNMDPNQRILLQEAWHCVEDSAIPLSELQRATTSVHVGSVAYDVYHPAKADVSTASGTYYFMLANRISYCFGLTGESQTMDTGCSSSFVALNSACRSLLDHSSDYAMVGGVNLDEVDANTFESKIHLNLYFGGEVLNIDGFCGGFNLQNAWSTAYVASCGVLSQK